MFLRILNILSWASAHGFSHFKDKKLRVGGYTEEVLEWCNYPHVSTHLDVKLAAKGYQINHLRTCALLRPVWW